MNTSGDAAEQVVRMSLEGFETVAKITGKGAYELAKLLLSEMKKPQRTKGRASLMTMLKQGKELKVFEIDDRNLKKFCEAAKKYGVIYHVLKDKSKDDHKCDIMIRAEDSNTVDRIFDRFKLGVDNQATIHHNIVKSKNGRQDVPEKQNPEKSPEDKFIEELFKKPGQPEKAQNDNPTQAKAVRSHPSEPSSKNPENRKSSPDTRDGTRKRPSVRKQLQDLEKQKQQREKTAPVKPAQTKTKKKGSRNHGRS